MDTRSRCNMGFPDDDEDDGDDFGKEASSHKELVVETVGGNDKNNNSADQKPSTSRSKHSATEQRWRRRINDRFRILRDLMPHGDDQKKDKASVLLEVIGYIQFLQAKVQKYELSYPGLSPDSAKLMLWKTSNTHGENIVDPVKHNIALHPLASFFLLMELFLLQGLCQTHQER